MSGTSWPCSAGWCFFSLSLSPSVWVAYSHYFFYYFFSGPRPKQRGAAVCQLPDAGHWQVLQAHPGAAGQRLCLWQARVLAQVGPGGPGDGGRGPIPLEGGPEVRRSRTFFPVLGVSVVYFLFLFLFEIGLRTHPPCCPNYACTHPTPPLFFSPFFPPPPSLFGSRAHPLVGFDTPACVTPASPAGRRAAARTVCSCCSARWPWTGSRGRTRSA